MLIVQKRKPEVTADIRGTSRCHVTATSTTNMEIDGAQFASHSTRVHILFDDCCTT